MSDRSGDECKPKTTYNGVLPYEDFERLLDLPKAPIGVNDLAIRPSGLARHDKTVAIAGLVTCGGFFTWLPAPRRVTAQAQLFLMRSFISSIFADNSFALGRVFSKPYSLCLGNMSVLEYDLFDIAIY